MASGSPEESKRKGEMSAEGRCILPTVVPWEGEIISEFTEKEGTFLPSPNVLQLNARVTFTSLMSDGRQLPASSRTGVMKKGNLGEHSPANRDRNYQSTVSKRRCCELTTRKRVAMPIKDILNNILLRLNLEIHLGLRVYSLQ